MAEQVIPHPKRATPPDRWLRVARATSDDRPRPRWHRPATVIALLSVLAGASVLLRLEGLHTWFWMDEGISVGISSHPLAEIPGLLRQDGSPPLYYILLHGWMRLFGSSPTSTHALSLLMAVGMVPVSYWAARSLFGARAGWMAAGMIAISPYLSDYSTETRMYTMVALLALVTTAAFVHAFAFRRRRYLPVFIASLTLLLYTHNWGLYLGLAAAVAVGPCFLAATDRALVLRDAAVAFGVAAVLILPWVPTLLFQARHTGAPWSPTPTVRDMFSAMAQIMGDVHERTLVALILGAGGVIGRLVLRPRTRDGSVALALVVIVAVTLGAGWVASQVKPAWSPRYFVVFFPAVVLLAALGLSRAGKLGLVALAMIVLFWVEPLGRLTGQRPVMRLDAKAIDRSLADAVAPELRANDVVVAMQMEELPVLHHYLRRDLRFATTSGVVADPAVADWSGALERSRTATPQDGLTPLLDGMVVGNRILLVCARDLEQAPDVPWFRLMGVHCAQWRAGLAADRRFVSRPVDALRGLGQEAAELTLLFEKTSP